MADASETSMSGYEIRPARAEDMHAVCDIAKRAWERVHDSFRTMMGTEMHDALCANWKDDKAAQIRNHFERAPEWVYVVTSADGAVAGFVTFRIEKDKSLGTIGNNAIDPDVQGHGLGTAMYEYTLEIFRQKGLRFATVHTGMDVGHAPARKAYERAGFNVALPEVTYYATL